MITNIAFKVGDLEQNERDSPYIQIYAHVISNFIYIMIVIYAGANPPL